MSVILAFGIGTQEILIIVGIAVLLFGATKLPQLGSAVGQTLKNFKRGMREAREEDEEAQKKEERKKLEASDGDNKPKEDAKDEKANS
ncbi:MAG: twin-arginine translocase TatA/TatE family subunit [Proteobacteria bacterium]|nr:twin-arginine translocase TatA/TatE family subunit [Pseudomonadota bacterium]